jgi:integrase
MADFQFKTTETTSWTERYRQRHGFFRLLDDPSLPNGRRGRVTIYRRGLNGTDQALQTFILSWCSKGKQHKERVVGDKFQAVQRADEICESLYCGRSPVTRTQLGADVLIERYLAHVQRRCDAGEISLKTPRRYRSALQHFRDFIDQQAKRSAKESWPPTRDTSLKFKAYLQGRCISPNGHIQTAVRPLYPKGISFIIASARAMTRWAVQEGLLPADSAHGFTELGRPPTSGAFLSSAPITTEQIIRLLEAADLFQLVLFSFYIFQGARVSEPCWLMVEFIDLEGGWVDYRCIDELGYRTKGSVDKQLPMPYPMVQAVRRLAEGRSGGPLLIKRRLIKHPTEHKTINLAEIIQQIQRQAVSSWSERARAGLTCVSSAGAIDGDVVRREFNHLLQATGAGIEATPKALRHYFATALEEANIPYYTRKYLLGHRLGEKGQRGGDVTAIYTHLQRDFVKECHQRVLDGPLAAVLEAFASRLNNL